VWAQTGHESLPLINLPAVAYVFSPGPPLGWSSAAIGDGGLAVTLHAIKPHDADGQVFRAAW